MTVEDPTAVVAALKAEADSIRELLDAKFTDLVSRQQAQNSSNEQANRFAADGLVRLERGQSEIKDAVKAEANVREADMIALRQSMQERIKGLEARINAVEVLQRDETVTRSTRWRIFAPLIAIVLGLAGAGLDRLIF